MLGRYNKLPARWKGETEHFKLNGDVESRLIIKQTQYLVLI